MSAGSVRRCLGCMLVFLMLTPGSLARQIEFWTTSHGDGITAMLVKELLPRFERETRIAVIHKSVQMNQDDLARVLVGGGPDVLVTWNGTMFTLVGANALVELTPYLNRWSGRNSFFPYFVQPISTLSEGRPVLLSQYTLPIEIAPFGIGYSKNAFSSAGLDPEAAPRGWDELESIAQKLTLKLSGRTIRQGFDTMWWHPEILATFLQLNGETGLSSDRRTARLNTDRAMETFEYLSRLYQAAYPRVQAELSGVTTPPSGSPMRLADGVTAMAFWSPALSLETRKRSPGTEIGVFAPTRSPGTEPKAPAYYKLIGMTQSSRDPAAAWELIQWLMEPQNTVLYHVYTQSLPSRYDVADTFAQAVPYMRDWYQVLQHCGVGAPMGLQGVIQAERNVFLQGLWGKSDLTDVIEHVNRRYQASLDEMWSRAGGQ